MNFTMRSAPSDGAKSLDIRLSRTHPLRDLDALAETSRYRRGEEICNEARTCEYWYRIRSGAAWRWRPLSDGRRRKLDLLGPGDYFGFCVPDDCGFAIEAASDGTTIMRYPRWSVEFLAEVEPETAGALRGLVREAVARMRRHLFAVREMTAAAKISGLLLDIADRSPSRGIDGFALPAPTADIADYLALSLETFERRLDLLTRRRTIVYAAGGRIRILDRVALEETRNEWLAEIAGQPERVGVG